MIIDSVNSFISFGSLFGLMQARCTKLFVVFLRNLYCRAISSLLLGVFANTEATNKGLFWYSIDFAFFNIPFEPITTNAVPLVHIEGIGVIGFTFDDVDFEGGY